RNLGAGHDRVSVLFAFNAVSNCHSYARPTLQLGNIMIAGDLSVAPIAQGMRTRASLFYLAAAHFTVWPTLDPFLKAEHFNRPRVERTLRRHMLVCQPSGLATEMATALWNHDKD